MAQPLSMQIMEANTMIGLLMELQEDVVAFCEGNIFVNLQKNYVNQLQAGIDYQRETRCNFTALSAKLCRGKK